MNKSDIKLDLQDRIDYLEKELKEQQEKYGTECLLGLTNAYQANKKFLILSDFVGILQLAEKKGLTYKQLTELIEGLPDKKSKGSQRKMLFPQ